MEQPFFNKFASFVQVHLILGRVFNEGGEGILVIFPGKWVNVSQRSYLAILCLHIVFLFPIMEVWSVSFSMLIYYNEYIMGLGVTIRLN